MAVPPNLDPASLRVKATGFRKLALEILPGEFRTGLLALAIEYECRAAKQEGCYQWVKDWTMPSRA
jgi:hypothetical protein